MPSTRLGQRRVALLGVVTILLVAGAMLAWRELHRLNEEFTTRCSLPDQQRCRDTEATIHSFPDMALDPRPDEDVVHIHVQPAPERWSTSVDPGFRAAEWSTEITLANRDPIVAACYYFSEGMVTCDTREEPWVPPSADDAMTLEP